MYDYYNIVIKFISDREKEREREGRRESEREKERERKRDERINNTTADPRLFIISAFVLKC